ncbi:MAG: tetratricopeptide repeat protein [Candidatus Hydrogenedentales bacterium]|jgi:tetratricopeptide (TPR) repeat protein
MDRFDWLELDSAPGVAPSARASVAPAAAARAMPTDGPSFYRAAREMRYAGHFKAATDFYRKAIGLDERNYGAWVELIDTLVRAGRLEEADTLSREASENYKLVRVFYAARALVLAHTGNMAEAMSLSDISIDADAHTWYSRCVRGELFLKADLSFRFEALRLYEEAQGLVKAPWEPAFLAGWALLDARQFALAASHLAEAAHLNARAPLIWLCLGDCFKALKFYEQALFYYQRVSELEPASDLAVKRQKECGSLVYGLMRLFRSQDLTSRWRREFEKALQQLEPQDNDY